MGANEDSGVPVEITYYILKHADGEEAKWNVHNRRREELHRLVNDLGLNVSDWGMINDTASHHESSLWTPQYQELAKYMETNPKLKNLLENGVADEIRIVKICKCIEKQIDIKTGSQEDFLKLYHSI